MEYENIELAIRNHVATITLNRPENYNSLNLKISEEFGEAVGQVTLDPDVKVITITGAGDKAFCAGGDVVAFAGEPSDAAVLLREMTGILNLAISRLAWAPKPVVAVVNGVAAGAGLSLVSGCDLVIASERATFASAYSKVGLTPDTGSTFYLPRIVGLRRTAELYMRERILTAGEALDWGLVNHVTVHSELRVAAESWVNQLAAGPVDSYASMKRLLNHTFNDTLESQLEREARAIIAARISPNGVEGVTAFGAKRRPDFFS
jgi:2-(1,2-epoxy-1,2-dihydrophenyl)acetyl-CoA isomerase